MGEVEIDSIAMIISFIIWLDIDITVCINKKKHKYKTKTEKFIEEAKAKGNYTMGKMIKLEYSPAGRLENGAYYEEDYTATYEYIVNGKKYYKKVDYTKNNPQPDEQNIYYKTGNPKKAMAEKENKKGFIYTLLAYCIPFSIFIGMPILSALLTILINIFK